MKRKFLSVLLSICLTITGSFMFSACGDTSKSYNVAVEIINGSGISSITYYGDYNNNENDTTYTVSDSDNFTAYLTLSDDWDDCTITAKVNGTEKTVSGSGNSRNIDFGKISENSNIVVEVIGGSRTLSCDFNFERDSLTGEFYENLYNSRVAQLKETFQKNITKVDFYKYNLKNPSATYTTPLASYTAAQIVDSTTQKNVPNVKHGDIIIAEFYTKDGYKIDDLSSVYPDVFDSSARYNATWSNAFPLLKYETGTGTTNTANAYIVRNTQTLAKDISSSNTNGIRVCFQMDKSYKIEMNTPSIYAGAQYGQVIIPTNEAYNISRCGTFNSSDSSIWNVEDGDFVFKIEPISDLYVGLNEYKIPKYNYNYPSQYKVYYENENGTFEPVARTGMGQNCEYSIPKAKFSRYNKIYVVDILKDAKQMNQLGGVNVNGTASTYTLYQKLDNNVLASTNEYNVNKTSWFEGQTLKSQTGTSFVYNDGTANYIYRNELTDYNTTTSTNVTKKYTYYPYTSTDFVYNGTTYKIADRYLQTENETKYNYTTKFNYNFNGDTNYCFEIVGQDSDSLQLTYWKGSEAEKPQSPSQVNFVDGIAKATLNSPNRVEDAVIDIVYIDCDQIRLKEIGSPSESFATVTHYVEIDNLKISLEQCRFVVKVNDGTNTNTLYSRWYFTINSNDNYIQAKLRPNVSPDEYTFALYTKVGTAYQPSPTYQTVDYDCSFGNFRIGCNIVNTTAGSEISRFLEGIINISSATNVTKIPTFVIGANCYEIHNDMSIYKNGEATAVSDYEIEFYTNDRTYTTEDAQTITLTDIYTINVKDGKKYVTFNDVDTSNYSNITTSLIPSSWAENMQVDELKYSKLVGANSSVNGSKNGVYIYTKADNSYGMKYEGNDLTKNSAGNYTLNYTNNYSGIEYNFNFEYLYENNAWTERNIIDDTLIDNTANIPQDLTSLGVVKCYILEIDGVSFKLVLHNSVWKFLDSGYGLIDADISDDIMYSGNTYKIEFNDSNIPTSIYHDTALTVTPVNVFFLDTDNNPQTPKKFFEINNATLYYCITSSNTVYDEFSNYRAYETGYKIKLTTDLMTPSNNAVEFVGRDSTNNMINEISAIPFAIPTNAYDYNNLYSLMFFTHPDLNDMNSKNPYPFEVVSSTGMVYENQKDNYIDLAMFVGNSNYYKNEAESKLFTYDKDDFINKYKYITLKLTDCSLTNLSNAITLFYSHGQTLGTLAKTSLQQTTDSETQEIISNGFVNANAVYAVYSGRVGYRYVGSEYTSSSLFLYQDADYITIVIDIENLSTLDYNCQLHVGVGNVNSSNAQYFADEIAANNPALTSFVAKKSVIKFEQQSNFNFSYLNGTTWTEIGTTNTISDIEIGKSVWIRCSKSSVGNYPTLNIYRSELAKDTPNSLWYQMQPIKNIMTDSICYDGEYVYFLITSLPTTLYITIQ